VKGLTGPVTPLRPAAAIRLIERLPSNTDPVALHYNPGPEHVFVDPSAGQLTGIIDFGDAYRSHPPSTFVPGTILPT
jgi:hygromycin-B 7''-O-kinase